MSFIARPIERIKLTNNNEYPVSPAYLSPIAGTTSIINQSFEITKLASGAGNQDGTLTAKFYSEDAGDFVELTFPLYKINTDVLNAALHGKLSGIMSGNFTFDTSEISFSDKFLSNFGYADVGDLLTLFSTVIFGTTTSFNILNIPGSNCLVAGCSAILLSMTELHKTVTISEDTDPSHLGSIDVPATGLYLCIIGLDNTKTIAINGSIAVAEYNFDPRYTGNSFIPTVSIGGKELSLLSSENGLPLNTCYLNLQEFIEKNKGCAINLRIEYSPTNIQSNVSFYARSDSYSWLFATVNEHDNVYAARYSLLQANPDGQLALSGMQ